MHIITNIMDICKKVKEDPRMILYTPLWETMRRKGISTYTLREKYKFSGSTVQRLKKNMSVSTNTLSDLCAILECELSDVAKYEKE